MFKTHNQSLKHRNLFKVEESKFIMGFLFWGRKKSGDEEHEKLHSAVDSVKDEFGKVTEWIKHLHEKDGNHDENLALVDARMSSLEGDISEIKDLLSFFGPNLFKHQQTVRTDVYEQTPIQSVQTNVRTRNKPDSLSNLTTMERAIIWVLLNTDLKLSYDDIAAILGKTRATIRGQVNAIKQKSEGLVGEVIEKTGKKRVYLSEQTKESLSKAMKIAEKGKNKRKKS